MSKILVIVAHSDDETLGCAGTIRRHVQQGDSVCGIYFTNGVGARIPNSEAEELRFNASNSAAKKLGFNWIKRGSFPDNALDTVPLIALAQFIESVLVEYSPDIIYTHSKHDLNIDHRRVFEAVLTAFRPQPETSFSEIRSFEVPSATEWGASYFSPTLFVDITEQWENKLSALSCYQTELREFPHVRSLKSIEALATLRGNQAGFIKGEAFEVIRKRVSSEGVI